MHDSGCAEVFANFPDILKKNSILFVRIDFLRVDGNGPTSEPQE